MSREKYTTFGTDFKAHTEMVESENVLLGLKTTYHFNGDVPDYSITENRDGLAVYREDYEGAAGGENKVISTMDLLTGCSTFYEYDGQHL